MKIQLLAALASLLMANQPARAQGYGPEEAAGKMTVAQGLQVTLFASEPEVRQPILVKCDTRGRVWVIQYLQYPNPAGLKRVKVDRYSRTTYDRVPEPPPKGPKGADRITILEDINGDGRADRFKDFVSGLNLCTGLAFGHGGVFVLQAPYLLFYPDHNRDDVPDSDPEVLLQGFGMEDSQALANHLTWGPDGWLYGLNGSTTTCRIRGLTFQQGVWRYHPRTREFELFADGGGNVYGLTFDANGNLFYSSNGARVFWHAVQGGYYEKSFGKHGPLTNPYTYGYFPSVKHSGFTGGHVVTGGTIYLGESFPEMFRGAFIGANFLGHFAAWWRIRPRGSTFEAEQAGILLDSHDTWFSPTDMALGPDGAMYLSDFHDARTAHPDPDAEWDRSNGRVYRIQAGGVKPLAGLDLERRPSGELVAMLKYRNGWYANEARVLLAFRRDRSVVAELRSMALQRRDANTALQGLWGLHASGGWDDETALQLLNSPFEYVRAWTVRLLGDQKHVSPALARRLAVLASMESSVVARSQLLATAKRLPAADGLPLVARILAQDRDLSDPHIPLLAWWAIESKAISHPDLLLKIFAKPEAWSITSNRDPICKLARRWIAEGAPAADQACLSLAQSVPLHHRKELLETLDQGIAERIHGPQVFADTGVFKDFAVAEANKGARHRNAPPLAPQLRSWIESVWRQSPSEFVYLRAAARAGVEDAYQRLVSLASQGDSQALGTLAELGREDCIHKILPLLGETAAENVRSAALDVVARFDSTDVTSSLLSRYDSFPPALKAKAREVLLSRASSAHALLENVDSGQIPAREIPVSQLRHIEGFGDAQLNALVRKHWGAVGQGTAEEKLAEVRRLNNDLRAGSGDAKSGERLFFRLCGQCHRLFGAGGTLAMDLTSANRADRMYLLTHIVDPSVFIRKEYMSHDVRTRSGRVIKGLLAEQDASSVTVIGADLQRTRIPRSDILSIDESEVSLMPENLLTALKPQQLRDLFAYLQKP